MVARRASEGSWARTGRAGPADRYGPLFRRQLEHARFELRFDRAAHGQSCNRTSRTARTFPRSRLPDIVGAQRRLLDSLGVRELVAVVGPSYGGFQAFAWGIEFPDFMRGLVPAVTGLQAPGDGSRRDGAAFLRRSELERRPLLRNARRHRRDHGGPARGHAAPLRHRGEPRAALPRSRPRATAEIARQARAWAHDVRRPFAARPGPRRERLRCRAAGVAHRARVLLRAVAHRQAVPADARAGAMAALAGAPAWMRATIEIDSEHGHLASGADAGKWAPALQAFMAEL